MVEQQQVLRLQPVVHQQPAVQRPLAALTRALIRPLQAPQQLLAVLAVQPAIPVVLAVPGAQPPMAQLPAEMQLPTQRVEPLLAVLQLAAAAHLAALVAPVAQQLLATVWAVVVQQAVMVER